MTKKGYGNVAPRFAKYFARHKNSAGPHDPKNARQEALDKASIDETVDHNEIFNVGENVLVVSGQHEHERGRIVTRRSYKGNMSYGIVFPWEASMMLHYVSGNQIVRDTDG